jgi:hypothetical protein
VDNGTGELVEDPYLVASNGTRVRERGVPVKEFTKTIELPRAQEAASCPGKQAR